METRIKIERIIYLYKQNLYLEIKKRTQTIKYLKKKYEHTYLHKIFISLICTKRKIISDNFVI